MLLSNPRSFLEQLLHLMILRRRGDYQANCLRYPELYMTPSGLFEVCVENRPSFSMTYLEILSSMQINMEDTDFCTVQSAAILATVEIVTPARHRSVVTAILALAICFFYSRQFLALLKNKVSQQERLMPKRCRRIVLSIIKSCSCPRDLFTRAFNPNRLQGSQVARSRYPKAQTRRLWLAVLKKLRSMDFVSIGRRGLRKTRRNLFCKVGRSLGCFRGKNFWQLVKLGKCSLSSYLQLGSSRCRPGDSEMYTETGPGARAMLNMLEQLPRQFCLNVNGQDCADVYNKWLHKWWKVWRKLCSQALRSWPEHFHGEISHFGKIDSVGFQFILCEGSKGFNFVVHLGQLCIYRRGYWRSLPGNAQLPIVDIPEELVRAELEQQNY